jgi:hypothetical protein
MRAYCFLQQIIIIIIIIIIILKYYLQFHINPDTLDYFISHILL